MTEAMIRKKSGMASVKDMPLLQDGPPPGGFAPVRFARRIPSKGPSAMAIILASFGAFSWGMYHVGKGNKVRRLDEILNSSSLSVVHTQEISEFWGRKRRTNCRRKDLDTKNVLWMN